MSKILIVGGVAGGATAAGHNGDVGVFANEKIIVD